MVPLVTKVALPIVIESLRRGGKFDTDRFYAEAKESLAKGFEKSKPEIEDLKDELSDRGLGPLRRRAQARRRPARVADREGLLARRGLDGRVRPRRRRFRLVHALGILAVVGIGAALVGTKIAVALIPAVFAESTGSSFGLRTSEKVQSPRAPTRGSSSRRPASCT